MKREEITQIFNQYASKYDLKDPKIYLKYEHTFKVAENSEQIAQSLGLSSEDVDLAWLLGIFHDIGRFEQVRRFHTFQDRDSVNHAALSADILFREGLIQDFKISEDAELGLMEKAIRLHNVYRLPESLTERENTFSNILRDADKIDILRVNCETPREEIYNLPPEAFTHSLITEEVYRALMQGEQVDRRYSATGIDFILGHIGFVYGLVYPESRRLVQTQGYLQQLLAFHSENPATEERLGNIRNVILTFLQGEEDSVQLEA